MRPVVVVNQIAAKLGRGDTPTIARDSHQGPVERSLFVGIADWRHIGEAFRTRAWSILVGGGISAWFGAGGRCGYDGRLGFGAVSSPALEIVKELAATCQGFWWTDGGRWLLTELKLQTVEDVMNRIVEPRCDEGSFDRLIRLLGEEDEQLRQETAASLCQMGRPIVLALIREANRSGRKYEHRIAILSVIQQIGGPLGFDEIFGIWTMLGHPDAGIRAKVADVLCYLSPNGPPTTPEELALMREINPLLPKPSSGGRGRCSSSLRKLENTFPSKRRLAGNSRERCPAAGPDREAWRPSWPPDGKHAWRGWQPAQPGRPNHFWPLVRQCRSNVNRLSTIARVSAATSQHPACLSISKAVHRRKAIAIPLQCHLVRWWLASGPSNGGVHLDVPAPTSCPS